MLYSKKSVFIGFKNFRKSLRLSLVAALASSLLFGCLEQTTTPKTPTGGGTAVGCNIPNTGFTGGIDPGIITTPTSATIAWNAPSVPNCNFVYKVYQLPNLTTPVSFATGNASSAVISGLTPGNTYQYIVRIFDGAKEDTNLAVVNVVIPPQTIGNFTINAITSSTNHQPTISWNAATNAQSYHLQIAWDPSFSTGSTAADITGLTTTSYSFGTDLPMGKYWVQVTASASGTPNVVASNAPQNFAVYPIFNGCLQQWYGGSPTGWQPSGCSKATGNVQGYLKAAQGLTYDSTTGYLFIGNSYGIARWDMNSFVSAGFMDGISLSVQSNYGWSTSNYTANGSAGSRANAPTSGYGCSDGSYYYFPGLSGVVERINLSTQNWAGAIGGGMPAWDLSINSSIPTTGNAINQFGSTIGQVACNSTDPYLYIADYLNHRISRWTKAGVPSGVWGSGTGAAWSMAACCGAGTTTTSMTFPNAINLSPTGVLYFKDSGRLNRITNLTSPVINGWICDTGWATAGIYPSAGCVTGISYGATGANQITSDNAGNFYLADSYYLVVRKFNSAGVQIAISIQGAGPSSPNYVSYQLGVAVKPDGSLIMVSDHYAARVLLYDSNFNYLGFIGNGYSGIASVSTARPPTTGLGMGSVGGTPTWRFYAVDSATDSLYIPNYTYSPGATETIFRYSLSSPASATSSMGPDLTTGAASPCTAPGANAACLAGFGGAFGHIVPSATTSYLYEADYANGRVNRWDKTTLTYGGWIGNGATGWQMTPTVAASPANCSFSEANALAVDASGNLYVSDGSGNRVSVWNESTGTCIGTVGGGNNTVQASLTSQAASIASKFFSDTSSIYMNHIGVLGDWLFVYDRGAYTIQRYSMTSNDPSTLTWAGWLGAATTNWKVTAYAGAQSGIFPTNTGFGAYGASGVYANPVASSTVQLYSLGDGSTIGKALEGPDYNFYSGSPNLTGGTKTGDGSLYSGPNDISFDPITKTMYLYTPGVAIVRYK